MTKRLFHFIFDKVICDETNNTKEDVDNGVVNVDIYGSVVDKNDIIDITIELKEDTWKTMTDELYETQYPAVKIGSPKLSNWTCYMFGNRPGGNGIIYTPQEGRVPNRFVRFMMRICFDCKWVKND